MRHHDARGVAVTAGRAQSLEHYETAVRQFQSYIGDPIATLDAALADDPDFITGHVMKALVLYTLGERKYVAGVEASLAQAMARTSQANERERMLMRAVRELADGKWRAGCMSLDRVLIEYPCDAVAVQAAHLMDFYRGDALNLRNRITRVLPRWHAAMPGYSYVLGMYAFGLEEMNQYREAEAEARRALEIEPRDGWAVHAATHVMEMQGRIDDGIAWLESREQDWAPDNGFAFHNFWHLALFYLDQARYQQVLALYDRGVHPEPSQILLSLVDASALLWRLNLEGIELGNRYERIADEWEAQLDAEAGYYAFNDLHAAMSFVACGRSRALTTLKVKMAVTTRAENAFGMMTREVGVPLVNGFEAFAAGRDAQAIEHIEPVRDIANRFGGSHAQRDILTLTLIEAAIRSGDTARARHYLAERQMLKAKQSNWAPRLARRIEQIHPRESGGATAR